MELGEGGGVLGRARGGIFCPTCRGEVGVRQDGG